MGESELAAQILEEALVLTAKSLFTYFCGKKTTYGIQWHPNGRLEIESFTLPSQILAFYGFINLQQWMEMPMTHHSDAKIMAVFCDFENVAIGVRDSKYAQFDIAKILERLLLKGNIVVKKAYCDWARYQDFKSTMHEASFELIEIPHVRQSGKNSADIRMVVDALDLCYTKEHVDTFVVISGDSDFSPLVSKLRENNKTVIGVGVKNSTSDLLIANCDEFIYYDDLVQRKKPREKAPASKGKPKSSRTAKGKDAPAPTDKKKEAWDLIVETYEALLQERGEEEKIWGSMIKQALKRRKPGFNESYYGFRSFGALLEGAEAQGILELDRDQKSGGFIIKNAHII